MQRQTLIAAGVFAGLVVLALLVVGSGLDDRLARLTLELQRDYQNALGRALRALRANQPGAVAGFLGICFAYGFFHALGPGHGKAVIAGYAMASGAPMRRLVGLALLSSMAQATVAVAVVYAGVLLWDGARDRVEGLARWLEPLGALAIAGLGALLLWRGLRRLLTAPAAGHSHHDHDHGDDHDHGPECGCGHAHGPDPARLLAATNWRETAALVLGVALRPCTGALFLLILTWRFGLDLLGITGAYVMGFGTFLVSGLAALLALALRRGLRVPVPDPARAALAAALIEMAFGGLILVLALSVALRLV